MSRGRRLAAGLTAALVMAMAVLTLTGATRESYIDWHKYAMTQQRAYFQERDRADAAEALATAHETAAAGLRVQVEALSLAAAPLRAEVARLREYERYSSLERDVEGLRSARSRLLEEIGPLQQQHAVVAADLNAAMSNASALAAILEKYGTSGVWLNTLMCCGSMEPAFGADDVGLMMNAPAAPLAVGDVAYFTCPEMNGLVAHRIIERRNAGGWEYRMKGDANPAADPCWVPHGNVQFITPSDAIVQGMRR